MMFLAIFEKDITISESLLIALVSMIIVFLVLTIIYLLVALMKYIKVEEKETKKVSESLPNDYNLEIKDDDMMAAVLVATIDYSSKIKKDVRLVSVKEII